MRFLIALILTLGLAAPAGSAEETTPRVGGYAPPPMERQIEALAPLGAVDRLTATALRDLGFRAYRGSDDATARAILGPLARIGDKEALYAYFDASKGRRGYLPGAPALLAEAAEAGDLRASALYAYSYLTTSFDQGLTGYDEGAPPPTFGETARWLLHGIDLPRRKTPEVVQRMAALLRGAAESGDPHAKAYWGAFQFHEPPLVSRSSALGERLLKEAAAEHVAFAHFTLGDLYGRGKLSFFSGREKAVRHFRAALDLGYGAEASSALDFYLMAGRHGETDDPDYQEAVRLAHRHVDRYGEITLLYNVWQFDERDLQAAVARMLRLAVEEQHVGAREFFRQFHWLLQSSLKDFHPERYKIVDLPRMVAWAMLAEEPAARRRAALLASEKAAITENWYQAAARVAKDRREALTVSFDAETANQAVREGRALAEAYRRGERGPLLDSPIFDGLQELTQRLVEDGAGLH